MATDSSIPSWRTPMDKGAWHATVPGVATNHSTQHRQPLEWLGSLCCPHVVKHQINAAPWAIPSIYSFGLLAHTSLLLVPTSVCTPCAWRCEEGSDLHSGQGEAVFILIWIAFWLLCTSPSDS